VSKFRRRAVRWRPGATRLLAKARSRRLARPESTSRWPAPARCPTGRALPSRSDLRPIKLISREGRRSGRHLPASSMTSPTASTPTPCRGAGRGGGYRTRRRRRARRQ
jgi:hypothetical protein